jgi:hypothetical protein
VLQAENRGWLTQRMDRKQVETLDQVCQHESGMDISDG